MSSNVPTSGARTRPRGLSITTNLPSAHGKKDDFINSAPPHKTEFGAYEAPPKRGGISEALMNDDWRQNRRPRDMTYTNTNGSPHKVKYDKKKLRVETSLANTGVRRYRTDKDTPVDPDFIMSAPATKNEFDLTDDNNASYSAMAREQARRDAIFGEEHLYFGPKHYVRLEPSELPQDLRSASQMFINNSVNGRSQDTIVVATPTDISDGSFTDVSYPYAELREVKHGKSLRASAWEWLDAEFTKRLCGLKLDKTKSQGPVNAPDAPPPPARTAEEEQAGFNKMLAKLNKSNKNSDQAMMDPKSSTHPDNHQRRRSPFSGLSDSGISGVGDPSPAKSSTLNPKAHEFYTSQQMPNAAMFGIGSPMKSRRPSVIGFFDDVGQQTGPAATAPHHDDGQNSQEMQAKIDDMSINMTLMWNKIQELEAEKKASNKLKLETGRNERELVEEMERRSQELFGRPSEFAAPGASVVTGPDSRTIMPPPGFGGYGADTSVSRDPRSGAIMPPPSFGGPAIGTAVGRDPRTGAIMPPPGFGGPTAGTVGRDPRAGIIMPPPGFGGPVGRDPRADAMMPPPGFSGPGYHSQPPMQSAQRPASVPVPTIAPPFPIGPKPVRKPKGPFRPGDPVQAKQQQAYEEYLEWRRCTDRAYAQQCRDRQMRRNERKVAEQTGTNKENMKS